MTNKQELNNFFVKSFNSILRAEERALEEITNGALSVKEIHLIEVVFKLKQSGENRFSTIAEHLCITMGTLTTAFSRLKKKGYLIKQQDAKDKRVFYIVPTRLAEMINEEHAKFHERMIDEVIKALPERELEDVVESLKTLSTFFEKFK